jgi:putative transposase
MIAAAAAAAAAAAGVGRKSAAHSAVVRYRACYGDAGLPTQPDPWGDLLFHGKPARPSLKRLVTQINALREAVRTTRTRSPFHIDAWVVLPDHMHCLWTLPEGDCGFPGRWRAIKIAFSKSLPTNERRTPLMVRRGKRGIWQRRYWEHTIRDDRDYAVHMDYIHFNPVKHGSTRSSTALRKDQGIGRSPASAAVSQTGSTRRIGLAETPSRRGPGSGGD